MSKDKIPLTRYSSGGVMEMFMISYPLIISAFSVSLMMFCDRAILARFSLDAMNSATTAGMIYSVFAFFGMYTTSIAEVFVGQYNGEQQYKKIAIPIWQMIWFSLALAVPFIIIAQFCCDILVPTNFLDRGDLYFKWVMSFAFVLPLIGALNAFFIGRGQTLIVTSAAIIANVINFILDIALVFGYKDIVPSMGVEGAAIASVIAGGVQFFVLFIIFLNRKNQKKYNTRIATFDFEMMKDCLKIGLPVAVSHTFEIAGWSLFFVFLGSVGKSYITVHTVLQAIHVLFFCFIDGISKGVIAVASNMIGANQTRLIKKMLKSTIVLYLIIGGLLLFPTVIYPDFIIDIFIQESNEFAKDIKMYSILALRATWLYFIFDGLAWIIASVLTAGGDTKFIMYANILSLWICGLAPVYLWISYLPSTPVTPSFIILLYCIVNSGLFIWRYASNKWHKLNVA